MYVTFVSSHSPGLICFGLDVHLINLIRHLEVAGTGVWGIRKYMKRAMLAYSMSANLSLCLSVFLSACCSLPLYSLPL